MEEARISIEGIKSVTDLIIEKIKPQKTYKYEVFWTMFIIPSDLKVKENDISCFNPNDRALIKKAVNEEFMKRGIPKLLFARKNIGFYLLDNDTGVAAAKLLERVRKIANANDALFDQCLQLSAANGLHEQDKRMLVNMAHRMDDNKSAIAGTVGRMRSIPTPVKLEAMRIMGVVIEEDD